MLRALGLLLVLVVSVSAIFADPIAFRQINVLTTVAVEDHGADDLMRACRNIRFFTFSLGAWQVQGGAVAGSYTLESSLLRRCDRKLRRSVTADVGEIDTPSSSRL
jgi:hypothetical protein